ncbi:MAG: hypothetical protein LBC91_03335, partial [Candidatus Accumulibacter sp.]|nr:hypothetical protein [Accumulibacter sp.]
GVGPGVKTQSTLEGLPLGKGEMRRRGKEVALLAFGSMLSPALQAAEAIDASVANMRFIKPIDRDLIVELAREHSLLVSIEENALIGGAGAEVGRVLEEAGSLTRFVRMGLPDRFIGHGDQARLLADAGLDEAGILRTVQTHRDEVSIHARDRAKPHGKGKVSPILDYPPEG